MQLKIIKYKYGIIIIFIFLIYKYIFTKKKKISNFLAKYEEFQTKNFTLINGRNFIIKCLTSQNMDIYEVNENPMITNIIPSYNCEKTIITSIHSIQYQNFSNIEIIIVDDFSMDNSKEIIKTLQINDKRIKLIENKRNMGTLYSRSIGALLSRGDYILCLDNDDLFFNEDIFDFLIKQSKKENLDLVSFRAVEIEDYLDGIQNMKDYRFFGLKNNLSLSQPELGIWTISLDGKFLIHDNEIWLKCIKSKIYKKAVHIFGIQRYSKYICWAEDTIINFIIFNIAESCKYVHKIGYIHLIRKLSATFQQTNNNKLYGELSFLDVMFDFTRNTSDKNFVVNYAINLKEIYKIESNTNNTNCKYLKFILNKIIGCQFITKENKQNIKNSFKSFFI